MQINKSAYIIISIIYITISNNNPMKKEILICVTDKLTKFYRI